MAKKICALALPLSVQSFVSYYPSPAGLLKIKATDTGISEVLFTDNEDEEMNTVQITDDCIQQLDEYFNKKRVSFDLPLDMEGSDFQKSVWDKLLQIPFGRTASYLDISLQLGSEKLTRAVGNANGKNKIAIIVPCHRVIGTNGTLTGYAGGMRRKKWLLDFEQGIEEMGLFS